VCEGEKDVDNVRAIGLTATCNSGGAGVATLAVSVSNAFGTTKSTSFNRVLLPAPLAAALICRRGVIANFAKQ